MELLREDARVRARFGAPSSGVFVLATGSDDEQALVRNDEVARVLTAARGEGLLDAFVTLHDWVWSKELQRRNFELVTSDGFSDTVRRALEPRFDVAAFEPFFEARQTATFDPLTLDALRGSAFARVVDRFVLSEGDRTLILGFPTPRDAAAARIVAERVDAISGVHWVDQRALLDDAYVTLLGRVRMTLVFGALGMALVLGVRFRRPRRVFATAIPALGAPLVGLAAAVLVGHSLNLFHLFAALVVMSMAMDYGIFASETMLGSDLATARTTTLSVVVAALTTCLGFGLLATSSLPVLGAIGVTVAAGVAAALLLVPVSLWAHAI
jgi:predicted exporter